MNSRGFTLVELIVVIAIISILTTIATLSWKRISMKGAIEGQVKSAQADMMRIRLEALYQKKERRVTFAGKAFNTYSSNVQTTSPLESKSFKYDFTSGTFVFNTSGLATGYEGSVCVTVPNATTNDAYVDSLVVTDGRISLGKKTGAGCVSNDIEKR